MKKLLLLLLIMSLCLASCRAGADIDAEAFMKKLSPARSGYIYASGADPSSEKYISPEELNFLYYGENTALPELEYTESFCIFLSHGFPSEEIHVFKAKHQSDTEALKRMLKSRAELLSSPQINPNQSGFFGESDLECNVFSSGRFVFLTAGKDIAELNGRIEDLV